MYRFHDPSIDSDHDLILTKFESLFEIVSAAEYDTQERHDVVDLFLHYTSSHLKREEVAMRSAGYPQCDEHVLAHAYLQHEFHSLLKTMPEGSPNLASDLHMFRQLFLSHIVTHDEAYGEWLNQQPSSPLAHPAQLRPARKDVDVQLVDHRGTRMTRPPMGRDRIP